MTTATKRIKKNTVEVVFDYTTFVDECDTVTLSVSIEGQEIFNDQEWMQYAWPYHWGIIPYHNREKEKEELKNLLLGRTIKEAQILLKRMWIGEIPHP